jgi:hypothetical protein
VNKGDEKVPNRTYGSEKLKTGKTVVEKKCIISQGLPPTLILKTSLRRDLWRQVVQVVCLSRTTSPLPHIAPQYRREATLGASGSHCRGSQSGSRADSSEQLPLQYWMLHLGRQVTSSSH